MRRLQTKSLPQFVECLFGPVRLDTEMIEIRAPPSAQERPDDPAWRKNEAGHRGAQVEDPRRVVVSAAAPQLPGADLRLADQRRIVPSGQVMKIVR